jgi:hypothetical protein
MVSLSPRFTVLAIFCNLAAISLSPLSASAVAIQARDSTSSSKSAVAGNHSRQQTPVLQLPSNAMKKSAAKEKDKKTNWKGKQHNAVSTYTVTVSLYIKIILCLLATGRLFADEGFHASC